MNFNIEVKNFGKIKDAKVKIAPFTIISGANSSGKSFLSRALYTFFSTINKDYVTVEAIQLSVRIERLLSNSFHSIASPSQKVLERYLETIESINILKEVINTEFGNYSFVEQHSRNLIIEDRLDILDKLINELLSEVDGIKKYEGFLERLKNINLLTKTLKTSIKDPTKILNNKLGEEFTNNIVENFQIKSLSELRNFNDENDSYSSFKIEKMGEIKIDKDKIYFRLNPEMVNDLQKLHNVVFIESPIYWKLRKPLLEIRKRINLNSIFNFHREKSELTGVPKYFFDLVDLLDQDNKLNAEDESFIDKILSNINSTLTGELAITPNGDIVFKDKDCSKDINLNVTATGITNLGILALLIRRNVITKGSFVFIDEPEINLHPAWQKTMIETLYELSRNGVNIVVATHSIDMIKYIENIMASLTREEIKEHFAVNRLSKNGISINEDDEPRKSLDDIKIDLGESYFNMTIESGW